MANEMVERLARILDKMAQANAQPINVEVESEDGWIKVHARDTQEAIQALTLQLHRDEQVVSIREVFNALPYDGAYALEQSIIKMFGWSEGKATESFWGDEPPARLSIEVGPNGQTALINWGEFTIPGIDGHLATGVVDADANHVARFQVVAQVKRKHEASIKALFAATREFLKTDSIYKGKAIKLRFDKNVSMFGSSTVADITFLDVSKANENHLVFSEMVGRQIKDYVYTMVDKYDQLGTIGMRFKSGVCLAGIPGVGKTEILKVMAKKATDRGITVIYCERASQLAEAVLFARTISGPCLVELEDFDRELSGERDSQTDHILNVLDGIDAKDAEVFLLLTSNDIESVSRPMLRPGRIDKVIYVTTPDARACETMLRFYGSGLIKKNEDLSQVADVLARSQTIPAFVAETVRQAKLSALSRMVPGETLGITAADLLTASTNMATQMRLVNSEEPEELTPPELAAKITADAMIRAAQITSGVVDRDLAVMN